jgi:hypothetical protein
MLEAVEAARLAGVDALLAHNLPPHPTSRIAGLSKVKAVPRAKSEPAKKPGGWSCDHQYDVMECDDSYETAIGEMCDSMPVVAGTSLDSIARYLVATETDCSCDDGLSCLPQMVPNLDGRELSGLAGECEVDRVRREAWLQSLDIWNPMIVNVLASAHKAVAADRNLAGLWLSLGGAMAWALQCGIRKATYEYHVRTDAAREALGRSGIIDMRVEGRHYAPIIARRLGRIAVDLIDELKSECKDFYFQTYTVPPITWKPAYQLAGMVGTTQELCERLVDVSGINVHMVVSHASECSSQSARHAQELIHRFPSIDFIAGVNWENNLRTSGPARLAEGYSALEVGMLGNDQWSDLPAAVTDVRRLVALL